MNFIDNSGTDRPVATAGVRATSDGNPKTAELLSREHLAAGPANVSAGLLHTNVLITASSAFLNLLANGSAHVLAIGRHFFLQLASLLLGRMPRFAAVGAFGAVLNLVIMSVMLGLGTHYLVAAVVATELTILSTLVRFAFTSRLIYRLRPSSSAPVLVSTRLEPA